MDQELYDLAQALGAELVAASETVTTAESCTGGWIAKTLTDVAGSSAWFERGFVTYSNLAKTEMICVPPALINADGAVSEEVVRAMAAGALTRAGADRAVAVSGIAGPDGGSAEKPVGTVWFAWARRDHSVTVRCECRRFDGDRNAVRRASVVLAIQGLRGPG